MSTSLSVWSGTFAENALNMPAEASSHEPPYGPSIAGILNTAGDGASIRL